MTSNSKNNVSFAGFYDWSIEELGEVSISNIYRKIANNPRNRLNRSKHWCKDGIHLVPGRMFLRDKAALTKGEKEIIYGIYKNRGDVQRDVNEIDHVRSHRDAWLVGKPVAKKDGKNESETCAIKVPEHFFSKESPRNTKCTNSPRSVCYMCTKNKDKCEMHSDETENKDTRQGRIAPPTSPLQSPKITSNETQSRTVDKGGVNETPRIVPKINNETQQIVPKTYNETTHGVTKTYDTPRTVSKNYNEISHSVSKSYNDSPITVSKTYNEAMHTMPKSYIENHIAGCNSKTDTPRNVYKTHNEFTGTVYKSLNDTPRRAVSRTINEAQRSLSNSHNEPLVKSEPNKPSSGKLAFQQRTAHGAVFVETGRTFFDPKENENKKKVFVNVFLPKIATQVSSLEDSSRTLIKVQVADGKSNAPNVIKTGTMDTTIMDKVPRISAVCSRET